MTDDIVARLRDTTSGYTKRTVFDDAANEIERLREALRLEQEELAACCIDRRETQRERDEARRDVSQRDRRCVELQYQLRDAAEAELLLQQEICRLVAERENMTSVDVAKDRGWDCYRCGFCGVVDTVDRTGTCRACNKDYYGHE